MLKSIEATGKNEEEAIAKALKELEKGGYDWLVLTSPSGVRIFFEKLTELSDIRALAGVKAAAIGQGSEKALRSFGIKADFVPSAYDAETLGRELRQICRPGQRLLIPRARIGDPALAPHCCTATGPRNRLP